MTYLAADQLQQHADYTHKYNLTAGRHGWLRLTPAYSVRIVEELLGRTVGRVKVLDPFCGTATTALSAAYHGHDAVTVDINPFLVWLGQAKTRRYSVEAIARARRVCDEVLLLAATGSAKSSPPPIHNIERWWSPEAIVFLCALRAAIDERLPPGSDEDALLRVAFCRTVIACSNAAFDHQSMSFRDGSQLALDIPPDYADLFRDNVVFVLNGAADNPPGEARVVLHDARELSTLGMGPFDLVITSPPYANRMSYIRELRPYMYWLGFLADGRAAGELDWLAIGGTWGAATSRLKDWKPKTDAYKSDELEEILNRLGNSINANGVLLAAYIRKYFADMARHLAELRTILKPGAMLHYVVGNSVFYGELVPVEKIYLDILSKLGFRNIDARPLRRRNSKRELIEFHVSAEFD